MSLSLSESAVLVEETPEHHALLKSEQTSATSATGDPPLKPLCKFYAQGRWCRFGRHCRFLHFRPSKSHTGQDADLNSERVSIPVSTGSSQKKKELVDKSDKEDACTHEDDTKEKYIPPHRKNVVEKTASRQKICRYFKSANGCTKGDGCRFWHPCTDVIPSIDDDNGSTKSPGPEPGVSATARHTNKNNPNGEPKRPKQRPCRYFRSPVGCARGESCKFWHSEDKLEKDTTGVSTQDTNPRTGITRNLQQTAPKGRLVKPQTEVELSSLSDEELNKIRNTEMEQLKKRFPHVENVVHPKTNIPGFLFNFSASDPDWSYDVKTVQIEAYFPLEYPKERMEILLPVDQGQVPDTLRRYLWHDLEDWLKARHKRLERVGRAELVFRPFLRWLDKNLEDLFTEGLKLYQKELMAKAAGIEFVPATQLQEKYSGHDAESEEEAAEDEEHDEDGTASDGDESEDEGLSDDSNNKPSRLGGLDPKKRGTEMKLHNLQLKEGASTLQATSIQILVACSRCSTKVEVITPPNRANTFSCPKCQNSALVTFRASLIHEFSSVMGYLDLSGCQAHDLILSECSFMIGCINCNKEMKTVGIPPGQPKDMWCNHCHTKLRIAVETCKFLQLQPSEDLDTKFAHQLKIDAPKKVRKDPAIQEGKALPDNGTCRHYKKSFRWLRFPCCGKAYPCDICHDDNEFDHDMKYANRMICGFCCKEQPYAVDKPCVLCQSSMVKKFTEHWEGGKGCRDKIKMARTDDKKYANINKTISRKAASKNVGKKVVKPRHT